MNYRKEMIQIAKRLLSMQDRNIGSNTYGCFDRNYWHYKQTDFPVGRFQEAVLTLSYLYTTKSNPYYKNERIKEWIIAGINYWSKIQNKNGSFDEWWPNESSYVTTAFSTFAVTESLLLLKEKPNKEVLVSIEKAAFFLMRINEKKVTNQEAGAAAALLNAYLITKKREYLQRFQQKKQTIIETQNIEGWWEEYGNVDSGYLSWMLYYLTKIYQKTKDSKIQKSIYLALDFLDAISLPDAIGGEVTARNTEYFAPLCFEYFQTNAAKNLAAIAMSQNIADLFSLDDRYVAYMTYAWIDASQYAKNTKYTLGEIKKYFTNAGIFVLKNKNIQLIYSTKKGGAFKIHFKGANYSDSGVLIKSDQTLFTSGFYHQKNKFNQKTSEGNLIKVYQKSLSPSSYVVSRGLGKTLFRSTFIAETAKKVLRNLVISQKNLSNIKFERSFEAERNKVIIIDKLNDIPKNSEIFLGHKYSFNFIPSSRYFIMPELKQKGMLKIQNKQKTNIKIKRTITNKGQKVEIL